MQVFSEFCLLYGNAPIMNICVYGNLHILIPDYDVIVDISLFYC